MKNTVELSVLKFTDAVMERVRCLKLEGATFQNEIPSRKVVSDTVLAFIEDDEKFRSCFNRIKCDTIKSSSEALFLAEPRVDSRDIIDDWFTGKYKEDEEYDPNEPYPFEDMVGNMISSALDIACCMCHNEWDKDDNPNDVEYFLKKTGIAK